MVANARLIASHIQPGLFSDGHRRQKEACARPLRGRSGKGRVEVTGIGPSWHEMARIPSA